MHIGFICNEYPPDPHGGIGSVTRTLAIAMARRGHRVTVVGYTLGRAAGETIADGVRVVRLPHATLRGTGVVVNGARLSTALLALHRAVPFDVIEGPEGSFATLPRRLRPFAVIRMHGGHHFFASTLGRTPRLQSGWLEKRSFARAANLCAVSQFVAARTLTLLDQRSRAVDVLPNPVDTELFRPSTEGVEPDSIVFAGTICAKKGVAELLAAMPAILDAVPGARLALVGRDSIDPAGGGSYAAMVAATLDDRVRSRVTFEGAMAHAQMPARLARAAVCVYPSHMEALPLAWLEGMAMGKCVVASLTGPGPEVITDGESGLLCSPFDPAQIAAKVIAALTQPALRERLGAGARRRVLSHFCESVLAEQNEAFYDRCVRARYA
jgi:glycosyltransferase involved in cell wall biosynthesis